MGIFGNNDSGADDLYHATLRQQQQQRNQRTLDATADQQRNAYSNEAGSSTLERHKRVNAEIELRKSKERLAIAEAEVDAYRNIAVAIAAHRRAYKEQLIDLGDKGLLPCSVDDAFENSSKRADQILEGGELLNAIAHYVDDLMGKNWKPAIPYPKRAGT